MEEKKKGRPPLKKVPINRSHIEEALAFNNLSLRALDIDSSFGYSEKTVRRAFKDEMINLEVLDALGNRLNVDPLFLSGEYDRRAESLGIDKEDKHFKSFMMIEKHPYSNKIKREIPSFSYVKLLLEENGIPLGELEEMDVQTQRKLYVEMDIAVNRVLWNYFNQPYRYFAEYEIPMPPEEEIISLD